MREKTFLIKKLPMFSVFSSHRHKKKTSSQLEGGTTILLVLITVIFILLTFFSISYHNRYATHGYQLKELRAERSSIMSDIEQIDMNISDSSAINKSRKKNENQEDSEESRNNDDTPSNQTRYEIERESNFEEEESYWLEENEQYNTIIYLKGKS